MTGTEHQTTTRTDIYLRLSDLRAEDLDAAGHSASLEHKERLLRDLAARLGWQVARVVIENDLMPGNGDGKPRMASAFKRRKIVTPSGRTEWRVFRPGFRSVLDDIASGRAAAVLAEDLDRACRDPRDLEDLVDVIREHKANARSLSGSLTLTSGGTDAEHLTARIMVAVANKSSADTARRVTEARQRQAEHGQFGGGGRPYGYARDGVTLIPAEAAEITRAAAAVLAGTSLKAVARDLRDRHVPTVNGKQWCAGTLRNILMRPRNAGIAVHHGTETGPALWPAILPEEQWRAVVALLTDPGRATGPGNAPRWLGSGIYRCGACGDGTTVHVSGGRPGQPGYRCPAAGHLRRSAIAADAYVGMVLCERLSRPDAIDLLTPPAASVDGPALQAEKALHQARLTEIASDYDDDLITRPQMLTRTAKRRAKIAAIDAQLAAASAGPDVLDGIAGRPDAEQIWDGLGLARQRAVLNRLAVVTLMPATRRGRGFDPDSVRVEPRQQDG